jgi:hypothetical protein
VLTGLELGLPPGQGVWQPTAAVLPDGRVRLYYDTPVPGEPPGGPTGLFSAISGDGVHFTPEAGQRWFATAAEIQRLADGRWRPYYTHHSNSGSTANGVASAVSDDGLSFTDEPGLRLANPLSGGFGIGCCGIVRLPDGRYRMYVSALQSQPGPGTPPPQIYSAVSSDLVDWTLEPGVRLTLALVHARTRAAATRDLHRARKVARAKPLVERDGCPDYEAAISGLTHKGSATALRRAKRLGFRRAVVERT